MTKNRNTRVRVFALLVASALAVAACGGAKVGAGSSTTPTASTGGSASGKACGTVNIAVNPWVGYEADAAVVGYLLKTKLGCTVVDKNLTEQVSWQGFGTGQVDVVLENWGHPELVKTYITEQKVAQDFGQTGNKGIIGWYVPTVDGRPVPGHHRLQEPEQVRQPVQDARSPAARASCSTATRPTSPTTRPSSRT